jgi:hypothetical protein
MAKLLNVDDPDNWRKFYKHINSVKGNHNSIPALRRDDDTLAESDLEKADALSWQYEKTFNSDPRWLRQKRTLTVPSDGSSPGSTLNSSFSFSNSAISSVIHKLKLRTSPGPDGIQSQLLKTAQPAIVPFLNRLFQISINNGTLPDDWSTAVIHPIFKNGDRSIPQNYRPISSTSTICKILERLVTDYIHFS